MKPDAYTTFVVVVPTSNGDRFFARRTRRKFLTAWSLAGAKHFMTKEAADLVRQAIEEKRGCAEVHTCTLVQFVGRIS